MDDVPLYAVPDYFDFSNNKAPSWAEHLGMLVFLSGMFSFVKLSQSVIAILFHMVT